MVNLNTEEVRDRLGNIDQVRELLFGHIVADYEQRFQTSVQRVERLEAELGSFQAEIRQRLDQLQDSLNSEFRAGLSTLEKQVQYLTYTSHEQSNHLQYRLHEVEQKSDAGIESLHQTVTTQTNTLKTDLLQTKENLEGSLRALEKRVFDEIDKDLSALREGKISRADLADLLFELCLKVKKAELIPALPSSAENSADPDYLLHDS